MTEPESVWSPLRLIHLLPDSTNPTMFHIAKDPDATLFIPKAVWPPHLTPFYETGLSPRDQWEMVYTDAPEAGNAFCISDDGAQIGGSFIHSVQYFQIDQKNYERGRALQTNYRRLFP